MVTMHLCQLGARWKISLQ